MQSKSRAVSGLLKNRTVVVLACRMRRLNGELQVVAPEKSHRSLVLKEGNTVLNREETLQPFKMKKQRYEVVCLFVDVVIVVVVCDFCSSQFPLTEEAVDLAEWQDKIFSKNQERQTEKQQPFLGLLCNPRAVQCPAY